MLKFFTLLTCILFIASVGPSQAAPLDSPDTVYIDGLPCNRACQKDDLLAEIDAASKARGYQNRSEIIRDLARAGLQLNAEDTTPSGQCVAALVYVYDHAARDLSKRLVQNFHGHHDLSLATLHVHLDDDSCLEVTALKGASAEVQHFADHIIAERGVRYGRIVMIPTPTGKKPRSSTKRDHRHG